MRKDYKLGLKDLKKPKKGISPFDMYIFGAICFGIGIVLMGLIWAIIGCL